jgi:hypothetical protein
MNWRTDVPAIGRMNSSETVCRLHRNAAAIRFSARRSRATRASLRPFLTRRRDGTILWRFTSKEHQCQAIAHRSVEEAL